MNLDSFIDKLKESNSEVEVSIEMHFFSKYNLFHSADSWRYDLVLKSDHKMLRLEGACEPAFSYPALKRHEAADTKVVSVMGVAQAKVKNKIREKTENWARETVSYLREKGLQVKEGRIDLGRFNVKNEIYYKH
jgi:hypothetical protein